jgi:hypothetical protein
MLRRSVGFIGLMGTLAGCGPSYDTILRHGTVCCRLALPRHRRRRDQGDTVAALRSRSGQGRAGRHPAYGYARLHQTR